MQGVLCEPNRRSAPGNLTQTSCQWVAPPGRSQQWRVRHLRTRSSSALEAAIGATSASLGRLLSRLARPTDRRVSLCVGRAAPEPLPAQRWSAAVAAFRRRRPGTRCARGPLQRSRCHYATRRNPRGRRRVQQVVDNAPHDAPSRHQRPVPCNCQAGGGSAPAAATVATVATDDRDNDLTGGRQQPRAGSDRRWQPPLRPRPPLQPATVRGRPNCTICTSPPKASNKR